MPTDPFIEARIRRADPTLLRHHRRFAELERAELLARLDHLDADLDIVSIQRAEVLARLHELRDQLWPRHQTRHVRRPPVLDRPPLPPVPDAASPLQGVELRGACLVLLRRHGPLDLTNLHALLHCHRFYVHGRRPVQRLSDALRYEVAQGRAVRLARGVYGAAAPRRSDRRDPARGLELSDVPLPWGDEEDGRPRERARAEAELRHDPSRWAGTAGAWDAAVAEGPGTNVLGIEIARQVELARHRAGALLKPIPFNPVGVDSSEIRRRRRPRGLSDWAGWEPRWRSEGPADPPPPPPPPPDAG